MRSKLNSFVLAIMAIMIIASAARGEGSHGAFLPVIPFGSARPIEGPMRYPMGETIRGKCSYLHIRSSSRYPGAVRIYADLPRIPGNAAMKGELLFCRGSWNTCKTFRGWVGPETAAPGKMAMSTLAPNKGEHVTVVRVPPAGSNERPCYQEINIENYTTGNGTFTTSAGSIDAYDRSRGVSAGSFLLAIQQSAGRARPGTNQTGPMSVPPQPPGTLPPPVAHQGAPGDDTSWGPRFVYWLNKLRQAVNPNLKQVVLDPTMTTYACQSSRAAAKNNAYDALGRAISGHPVPHNTFENTTPAANFAQALSEWLNSPPHKRNFFQNVSRVGLCAVKGQNWWYWAFDAI